MPVAGWFRKLTGCVEVEEELATGIVVVVVAVVVVVGGGGLEVRVETLVGTASRRRRRQCRRGR